MLLKFMSYRVCIYKITTIYLTYNFYDCVTVIHNLFNQEYKEAIVFRVREKFNGD